MSRLLGSLVPGTMIVTSGKSYFPCIWGCQPTCTCGITLQHRQERSLYARIPPFFRWWHVTGSAAVCEHTMDPQTWCLG